MVFCQHAISRKVQYTKLGMRDVVNNQDVGQVHQDDKEILQCVRDEDPWEREDKTKSN